MDGIYLVTGAAGHLGSVVTEKLAAAGKKVRALMLPGETRHFSEKVEIFHGDVREPASMEDFFATGGPERVTVIHCAGIVSIASRYDSRVYDVNVNGTRNVVELCRRHRVNRLVYVSSVHAIPEKPVGEVISEIRTFSPDRVDGLYAKTKAEATALVLEAGKSGLDVCVVHPSGIIGPYDAGTNHLTEMVASFCRGKLPAAVRGGYDFVDSWDVADGILGCERFELHHSRKSCR